MVQGPSVSIDTACSSSLVGAHLAHTSFLSADCPRALLAGVNLTMRAETTAVLSKAGMLAQASLLQPAFFPAVYTQIYGHSEQHADSVMYFPGRWRTCFEECKLNADSRPLATGNGNRD